MVSLIKYIVNSFWISTEFLSFVLWIFRSFANDACNNKSKKQDNSEKFNKRIPKPGPGCKQGDGGGDCKPAKKVW